jgi:hypothetical protein
MVYTTPTSVLPERFTRPLNVVRRNNTTVQLTADPDGLVHLQAGKLWIDMTNLQVSKTVPINEQFFDANPTLRDDILGSTLDSTNLPHTVHTTLNTVWNKLITPPPKPEPVQEPEETAVEEPPPAVEEPPPAVEESPTVEEPPAEAAVVEKAPEVAALNDEPTSFSWW